MRIKSFSSNTAGDVKAAVERFKSSGVSRIVVDLRGNVGGLLPGGIDTAGLFLDSGKVSDRLSKRFSVPLARRKCWNHVEGKRRVWL